MACLTNQRSRIDRLSASQGSRRRMRWRGEVDRGHHAALAADALGFNLILQSRSRWRTIRPTNARKFPRAVTASTNLQDPIR